VVGRLDAVVGGSCLVFGLWVIRLVSILRPLFLSGNNFRNPKAVLYVHSKDPISPRSIPVSASTTLLQRGTWRTKESDSLRG
jgi:hypothetical protein